MSIISGIKLFLAFAVVNHKDNMKSIFKSLFCSNL